MIEPHAKDIVRRSRGSIIYESLDASICNDRGKLLKKLDDRTRMLVHLGTEPGLKAYRLVDPNTRKIVVNRDVVFDETKS